MAKIEVLGRPITIQSTRESDYISITDIARYKDPERTDYIIQNWLRNRSTIEFLGIWEQLNNPDFKPIEFDGFRRQAGLNSFVLTAKQWIETTNAIGLRSKQTPASHKLNELAIQQMKLLTEYVYCDLLEYKKESPEKQE